MEASGGYERDYARSLNMLAKMEAINAKVLARFGAANQPTVRPRPSGAVRTLSEGVGRRKQLATQCIQEKNRREHASGALKDDIEAHIVWLSERIKGIETRINAHIESHTSLRDKRACIIAVPGIGDTSALLAALPVVKKTHKQCVFATELDLQCV